MHPTQEHQAEVDRLQAEIEADEIELAAYEAGPVVESLSVLNVSLNDPEGVDFMTLWLAIEASGTQRGADKGRIKIQSKQIALLIHQVAILSINQSAIVDSVQTLADQREADNVGDEWKNGRTDDE